MLRLLAAALVAATCWLAFTVGGARLLARQLHHVAGVPVAIGRLGLDVSAGAFVLHDVRSGPVRATIVRMPAREVAALLKTIPTVRDVTMRGIRATVPDGRGAHRMVRAHAVEIDWLLVHPERTVRFAGRIMDRHGRMTVRGRWRGGHVRLAAALRAVDGRTVAPLVTAAAVRGGRLDGRLHLDGAVVRADVRARELVLRGRAARLHGGRLGMDGLVVDLNGVRAAARHAGMVGATVRRDGFAPLRRVAAIARGLDSRHAGGEISLRATLGGGRIRARGTVDPPRGGIDAEVKADRVALAPLLSAGAADLRMTGGRLSARTRVAGPPWAATDVRLALDGVRVVESAAPDAEPVLACDRARADAERIDGPPLRARLRRASLEGLALRVRREPGGIWPANRLAAVAAWPAVQALLATPPDGSGPAALPALEVSWASATLVLEDRVVDPPARLAVHDVAGVLQQQAGESRQIVAAVDGTIEAAPFAADFAGDGSRWRSAVAVSGLDVSLLDPWLDLGATGVISVHSEIDWHGREFAAPSRVTADRLALDGRDGAARLLGLPLARALALAGDEAGRLTLILPVSGTTAEAGKAVVTALADALTPLITSPVASIEAGAPVVVPFGNGSDALDQAAGDVVDRVAALLHHRPALVVTVKGRVGAEDASPDPEALTRARAERVRERLCRERGVPEDRVRLGASAIAGPSAAIVERAS